MSTRNAKMRAINRMREYPVLAMFLASLQVSSPLYSEAALVK